MKAFIYNKEGVLANTIEFRRGFSLQNAIRMTEHTIGGMEDLNTPYWGKIVLDSKPLEPHFIYGKTYQMKKFFKEHPFCITDWDYIVADMGDKPTLLDKINLLTKEWKELNINTSLSHYANEWNVWGGWLNEIFGFGSKTQSYNGVSDVWISGFNYTYNGKSYGSRYPRVHITYYKGSIWNEHIVTIGDQPTKDDGKHRAATLEETEKVYQWMQRVIQYRKDDIAKQKSAPSFDEMKQLCIDEANKLLKDSKYSAEPMVCSSQANPDPKWRLVFYYKGVSDKHSIFAQAGAMTLYRDKNGYYHGEYMACSVHSSDWKMQDWHEYKDLVKRAIQFLG